MQCRFLVGYLLVNCNQKCCWHMPTNTKTFVKLDCKILKRPRARHHSYVKRSGKPRHSKSTCPGFNVSFQLRNFGVFLKACFKVFQFLTLRSLNLQRNLAAPVKEFANFLEIVDGAAPCRHRWCTDTYATRRKSRR